MSSPQSPDNQRSACHTDPSMRRYLGIFVTVWFSEGSLLNTTQTYNLPYTTFKKQHEKQNALYNNKYVKQYPTGTNISIQSELVSLGGFKWVLGTFKLGGHLKPGKIRQPTWLLKVGFTTSLSNKCLNQCRICLHRRTFTPQNNMHARISIKRSGLFLIIYL